MAVRPAILHPSRRALCCARTTRVCPTPTFYGPTACPYSCTHDCPVHNDDTQVYCTAACFDAAHPQPLHTDSQSHSISLNPSLNPSHRPLPPPPPPERAGKYVLSDTLGQGTFSRVRLGVDSAGLKRAIKVIDRAKVRAAGVVEQVKRGIRIMKEIRHDNIVQLYEVLASSTSLFLVLELVQGRRLFDVIAKQGKLEEDDARRYFWQLVSGLSYCHERGVCHRDLKPEHMMLTNDGVLKISNFGSATMQEWEQKDADGTDDATGSTTDQSTTGYDLAPAPYVPVVHIPRGTPNYVAPEVLMDKGYDGYAADVWSAGVILYVLLAGFLPFDEVSMVDLFRKIMKADFSYPAWLSAEAKHLLSTIITPNVHDRATLQQVMQHPWMTEVTRTVEEDTVVEEAKDETWGKEEDTEWRDDDLEAQEAEADDIAGGETVGQDQTGSGGCDTDWTAEEAPLLPPSSESLPSLPEPQQLPSTGDVSTRLVIQQFYAERAASASNTCDTDAQFAVGQFYAESDPEGVFGSAAYNAELYVSSSPQPRTIPSSPQTLRAVHGQWSTDAWDDASETARCTTLMAVRPDEQYSHGEFAAVTDAQDSSAALWSSEDNDLALAEAEGSSPADSGGDGGRVDEVDVAVEEVSDEFQQLIDHVAQLVLSSQPDTPHTEPATPTPTTLPDQVDSTAPTSPRRRMSDPGDMRPAVLVSPAAANDELDLYLSFIFRSSATVNNVSQPLFVAAAPPPPPSTASTVPTQPRAQGWSHATTVAAAGLQSVEAEVTGLDGAVAQVTLQIVRANGRRHQIKFQFDFRLDSSYRVAAELVQALRLSDVVRAETCVAVELDGKLDPFRRRYFLTVGVGSATSATSHGGPSIDPPPPLPSAQPSSHSWSFYEFRFHLT